MHIHTEDMALGVILGLTSSPKDAMKWHIGRLNLGSNQETWRKVTVS